MRTEAGKIQGDLEVTDGLILMGMVQGSVRVGGGGQLRLLGTVSGDLAVEPGGEVELVGLVRQDATNSGGNLTVVGTISGRLYAKAGRTRLDKQAVVKGGIEGDVERVEIARSLA